MFQSLDQPIMRRAEKEHSANNFLGDLIICYDFVIVAHLGCSCSDRKRVNKYKPTRVLYLARPWSPCRLLSSHSFPDVKGVFFFFSPLRFEMVVQSSQVLQLLFFPHSGSFQGFNCTAGRCKRRKQNKL